MFWRHVKAEHNINEATFKARHSNGYIVHKTTHVCGLCSKEITYDNGKLKVINEERLRRLFLNFLTLKISPDFFAVYN